MKADLGNITLEGRFQNMSVAFPSESRTIAEIKKSIENLNKVPDNQRYYQKKEKLFDELFLKTASGASIGYFFQENNKEACFR